MYELIRGSNVARGLSSCAREAVLSTSAIAADNILTLFEHGTQALSLVKEKTVMFRIAFSLQTNAVNEKGMCLKPYALIK